MKRFGKSLILVLLACLSSCSRQTPSADTLSNRTAMEHEKEVEALLKSVQKEVLEQQRTNHVLTQKLSKLDEAMESLKMLINLHDKRINSGNDAFSAYTNACAFKDDYISQQLSRQQSAISNINVQLWTHILTTGDGSQIAFNASESSGYLKLSTSSGFFLVSLKSAEPYLDGYKVTFEIGNPLSATYEGLKFNVTWGKPLDPKALAGDPNAYSTWQANLHTKEISLADKLAAGAWNKVSLILSPAKSDELGYIALRLETPTASLRKPVSE